MISKEDGENKEIKKDLLNSLVIDVVLAIMELSALFKQTICSTNSVGLRYCTTTLCLSEINSVNSLL